LKHTDTENALTELQDLLNTAVLSGDLNSSEILDISIKLDRLIVEYYLEKRKE
jgi:hypothetical protein